MCRPFPPVVRTQNAAAKCKQARKIQRNEAQKKVTTQEKLYSYNTRANCTALSLKHSLHLQTHTKNAAKNVPANFFSPKTPKKTNPRGEPIDTYDC